MAERLTINNGDRYGQLTVIREMDRIGDRRAFKLKCDCGSTTVATLINLSRGKTRSCGCLAYANARTHGMTGTPEYTVWVAMLSRCTNPKNKSYPNYGGRGITVCERWQTAANFFADMGQRPSPQHEITRIDNDGHYEPSNCEWSDDAVEQVRNRRRQTNAKSRYRGVNYSEGWWRVRIFDPSKKSRMRYIGRFKTEVEAAEAYDAVARLHRGFILNFPENQRGEPDG